MNRDYLIKLTLALHKEAEAWPSNNILKDKAENLANEVLADYILASASLPKDTQALIGCLVKARNEKAIKRESFLLFQKEYNRIKDEIRGSKKEEKVLPLAPAQVKTDKEELNGRQKKILNILSSKGKTQVWELKEVFLDTSKRTLRRDLDELLKNGLVKRDGQWNEVFYSLS